MQRESDNHACTALPDALQANHAYFEKLYGHEVGWPLAPVLTWLLDEGRRLAEPARFLRDLCSRLEAVGAPLWRLGVDVRTIHPRIAAWHLTWERAGHRVDERTAGHGFHETVDYVGSPAQRVHETHTAVRCRLDRLDAERDHPSLLFLAARGGVDYVAMPLVFSNNQVNVLVAATDRGDGFADLDLAKLKVLAAFLAGSFEIFVSRRTALALLDTYVGPRAGRRVLEGLIRRGDGETIDAAIWFSDLRDFTPLTESLPAERVLAMLNVYFEFIDAAVTAQGGEILRFVGDAMLIVFPTGPDGDRCPPCRAALEAARDALTGIATVNMRRLWAGEPAIRFGLGLDVGEVVYGNVGAPDRLNFTVMGPVVNRAARLESLTKTLGHAVLTSAEFAGCLGEPARSLGFHAMKGVAAPQEIFVPPMADSTLVSRLRPRQ